MFFSLTGEIPRSPAPRWRRGTDRGPPRVLTTFDEADEFVRQGVSRL